jgi:hypothetical protein
MDLATVDKLLTTTRTVRKRLDFTRAVAPEIIQMCLEVAIQAPTGGTSRAIISWWSQMQPNVLLLLPSISEHTSRHIPHSGKRRSANRTPA